MISLETIITIAVIVGVVYITLDIMSRAIFGGALVDVIRGARPTFKDVDAQAHFRLFKELSKSAILSKGSLPKHLWLVSLDVAVRAQEPMGRLYLGRIKGVALWQSCVLVLFRPGLTFKRMILFAPTDCLLSSEGSRNILIEGIGVKVVAWDMVHPIPSQKLPSQKNARWNEHDMHLWAIKMYKALMTIHSDYTLRAFQEHLLIKAGSDPTTLRMVQQGIADMTKATDSHEEIDAARGDNE